MGPRAKVEEKKAAMAKRLCQDPASTTLASLEKKELQDAGRGRSVAREAMGGRRRQGTLWPGKRPSVADFGCKVHKSRQKVRKERFSGKYI